jgi:hypothetical protein
MSLTHGPLIVTSGLSLCLDAVNIKSYPGSGTKWYDLSTSNRACTLNNGPSYTSGIGGYFTFDGVDDNVTVGTLSGYGTSVTCEAVFKTTSGNTWKNIICGPTNDVIFTVNGGLLNFGCQGSSPIPHANYSTTTVNTGAWFHGVATYDGSNVRVYINGVKESTNARTGTITPGSLYVGSNSGGSSEFFVGQLGFVKMYNTVLTDAQVLQNFNAVRGRYGL